ncbi:hypothetical protein N481_19235 [Pseudoalteromonas luteoviolacea S4047-1]|uniref:Uncharacterized protein n=1 Tax=Pseudoalteromonas luteoviolacea S4054 TaxID=1129367 RepID=A0A0F6AED9_9GAMM|nr:hypothetical protein N479_08185 [Pseudoalteromonas luteoviolacea S4054]KZN71322.1 hypothetical protein N481_19235 [Pseudoalteromonas luteoviolacea S4047-1]
MNIKWILIYGNEKSKLIYNLQGIAVLILQASLKIVFKAI